MQDKRVEALLNMLAKGNTAQAQQTGAEVASTLTPSQRQLLHKAMSDRGTAEQLLKSPQAIELLKKLKNGGAENGSE